MKIKLTQDQVQALALYFARVRAAADLGLPGMLVAQLKEEQNGDYVMIPAFLQHRHARIITEKGISLESAGG